MRKNQAIIITHAETDVIGSLSELLPELGIDYKVIPANRELPDPSQLELVFIMGSPESAYDHRLAWLPKELVWLKKVQEYNIATFGICFGSQLLTRALDGQVFRNNVPEIGWTPIVAVDSCWQHEGPWLNFHFDAFTVADKVTLLAQTAIAQQAYRKGRAMGVQFHPEIDTAMFKTWLDFWNNTEEGQRFLKTAGDLPERINAEIAKKESINRDNCKQLLIDFLNNI